MTTQLTEGPALMDFSVPANSKPHSPHWLCSSATAQNILHSHLHPCLAMGSLHPLVTLLEQLLLASKMTSKAPSGFGPGQGSPCSGGCPAKGCAAVTAAHGQGATAPQLGSSAVGSRAGCVSKATGRLPAQGCAQKVGWGEHGGDTPEPGMAGAG